MAAALAVRARQIGLRALVITVDPAKRLATSMGLDLTGVEEREVPSLAATGGSLAAAVVDSKRVFDDFVATHSNDPKLFEKLSKNALYQQLSTTLSGSQEFTALERLLQAYESDRFDLIILDTPPTQHAIDFLSAPERIQGLFQDAITKWFMNPDENSGFLKQGLIGSIIGRGTRVALKSLEILTGAKFIDELIDFFHSIRSIQKTLRERSDKISSLLRSQEASFVLVTSFDAAKLLEARHLSSHLKSFGYDLGACILNRAFPEHLPDLSEIMSGDVAGGVSTEFKAAAEKLVAYHHVVKLDHAKRFELFEDFERKIESGVIVLRVPEYRQDLFGLEDLEALAKSF
jgi:anion-transporting  ArsA/GET3 family ATPase